MACSNCDHTMQKLDVPDRRLFWCPRCGTVKNEGTLGDDFWTPALVVRCREFEEALANPATGAVGANLRLLWHTEGIDESINPPGQRGKGH